MNNVSLLSYIIHLFGGGLTFSLTPPIFTPPLVLEQLINKNFFNYSNRLRVVLL